MMFKSLLAFLLLALTCNNINATVEDAVDEYEEPQEQNLRRGLMRAPLKKLIAIMSPDPGYNGPLNPSGFIRVEFRQNDFFEIILSRVAHLESSITGGGVHIHTGTSCNAAGGHYWNGQVVNNQWGRSKYDTFGNGKPKRSIFMFNGYDIDDNVGHAIVIHAANGQKIACGVLDYEENVSV